MYAIADDVFPRLDHKSFRATMGLFATGVAVVTTEWHGRMFGTTVNSLTSVSLHPCLLLVCLNRQSETGEAIKRQRQFAVSLLSEAQRDVSERFVRKGNDRFAGLEIICSDTGLPMPAGALAYFCCQVRSVHEGGDHDIIVAEVYACRQRSGQPLVFYRGAYVVVSIDPVINGTRARVR
jgi:3-hydroxy-9,10-secoandrosta-1,3,5(10)-triene-9,17-dione monooxygenase reductase component